MLLHLCVVGQAPAFHLSCVSSRPGGYCRPREYRGFHGTVFRELQQPRQWAAWVARLRDQVMPSLSGMRIFIKTKATESYFM